MKKLGLVVFTALFIATGAIGASGQRRLSVSGAWRVDASRSRFSAARGRYKDIFITFEQYEQSLVETLTVVGSRARTKTVVRYSLDGKETVSGTGDEQVRTKAWWNGKTLTLQWTDDGGTFTQELSVSPDKQTLTVKAHDSSQEGDSVDLLIFSRQPRLF